MNLNQLKPAAGAKRSRKRVGRGLASCGKTCGRGEKGQHKRNTVRIGFEGGAMPFIQRIPKFGFTARCNDHHVDLPLFVLGSDALKEATEVNLQTLIACHLIPNHVKSVKFYLKGNLEQAVTCKGLRFTKGARALLEKVGGQVINNA